MPITAGAQRWKDAIRGKDEAAVRRLLESDRESIYDACTPAGRDWWWWWPLDAWNRNWINPWVNAVQYAVWAGFLPAIEAMAQAGIDFDSLATNIPADSPFRAHSVTPRQMARLQNVTIPAVAQTPPRRAQQQQPAAQQNATETGGGDTAALRRELQDMQAQLRAQREAVTALQAQLTATQTERDAERELRDTARTERDTVQADLRTARQEMAGIQAQLRAEREAVTALQAQLTATQTERDVERERCDTARARLDTAETQIGALRVELENARANADGASFRATAAATPAVHSRDAIDAAIGGAGPVARGGFGAVYRAVLDGHDVAIKTQDPAIPMGDDQFLRELVGLGTVRHAHVVPLTGVCFEGGHCLISPWMAGGDASGVVENGTGAARIRVVLGLARGLAFLHGRGQVHCDVKSANVLLDGAGNARLGDLGLVLQLTGQQTHHTMTHAVGTLGYMDVQALDTGHFTFSSDVWSFGVVVLEMLTGRPAHRSRRGNQRPEVLTRVLRAQIREGGEALAGEAHTSLDARCARGLAGMAAACLKADVDERPTMEAMASAAEGLLDAATAGLVVRERECVVCMSAAPNTRLRPCLHSVLCVDCAGIMTARRDVCPICRSPITDFEEGDFEATYAG